MQQPISNPELRTGRNMDTPWGRTETEPEEIAPGLWETETPGHGGLYLEPEVLDQIPQEVQATLRNGNCWAEEDCEAIIIIALLLPQLAEFLAITRPYYIRQSEDGEYETATMARKICQQFPRYQPGLAYLNQIAGD